MSYKQHFIVNEDNAERSMDGFARDILKTRFWLTLISAECDAKEHALGL